MGGILDGWERGEKGGEGERNDELLSWAGS